ncbi:MAG: S-methyl-5'-thioinosine phosphorylase [Acidimicrobiales bacterium]
MFGFITGSGFYELPGLEQSQVATVDTPYGEVDVTTGTWHDQPVAFLPRHGGSHSISPQQINYRANIWALASVGVSDILATAVSGGIADHLTPGSLVLIDDFIDWTTGRADTFFDNPGEVRHTDMSAPYDPSLRAALNIAAEELQIPLVRAGTYICFNGPRFETRAEIRMARTLGADLVGMTGYPEVALAVEHGVRYASVGVISNPAAGLSDTEISIDDIWAVINDAKDTVLTLFARVVQGGTHRDEEANQ